MNWGNLFTCNRACPHCPSSCLSLAELSGKWLSVRFNGVDMSGSEWMQSSFSRTRPRVLQPACTAPIQLALNWIVLSSSSIHFLQRKLITCDLCICVYVHGGVCEKESLCTRILPHFKCSVVILIFLRGSLYELDWSPPSFLSVFPPSLLFLVLRMWSRLSSSLVPPSSRRLCWCWTSWRSTTGTSSPLSRQSSPATRSSSIS